jgi:hypothetical protein
MYVILRISFWGWICYKRRLKEKQRKVRMEVTPRIKNLTRLEWLQSWNRKGKDSTQYLNHLSGLISPEMRNQPMQNLITRSPLCIRSANYEKLAGIPVSFIKAITFAFCCCVARGETASAEGTDKLPVYEVIQNGFFESQLAPLRERLKLRAESVSLKSGVVSYACPSQCPIPTRSVTDPAVLEKMQTTSRDEASNASTRYDMLDADGIGKLKPIDASRAEDLTHSAFAAAGINLESVKLISSNSALTASYKDLNGNVVSVDRKKINTTIKCQFVGKNEIPFVGPGAQLAVTYSPQEEVTFLHYCWRELKEGPQVDIIPETEAKERVRKLLPPNTQISLKLVYWCPPLETSVGEGTLITPKYIIPWYSVSGSLDSKNQATGRSYLVKTENHLVPATDDPQYVPRVRLRVSGSGSTRVRARVTVKGGREPYTYVWSGSNPVALKNSVSSVSYTAMVSKADSNTGKRRGTVLKLENVSVTVTDSNGIPVSESGSIWVQAQPFSRDSGGVSHEQPSYGCEVPNNSSFYARGRKHWQDAMGKPGSGGGSEAFCWCDDCSWPGDYIRPLQPGSLPAASPWVNGDADYSNWGIDTANLVLVIGDGLPDKFTAMSPRASSADYKKVFLCRPGNLPYTPNP